MSEVTDWNKLTIPQLKEHLKKRGLDQSGKKADLIGRLVVSDNASQEEETRKAGEGSGESEPVEGEEETAESRDVEEQMDTSDNRNADETTSGENAMAEGEEDFTENITFEELQQKKDLEEAQPALESTETVEAVDDLGAGGDGVGRGVGGGGDAVGEGEGKQEIAAVAAEEEEQEEEPDVSEQFAIDMPKDRDCFRLTWNSKKFIVPFRNEVNSDLVSSYKDRSLLVQPVDLSDLSSDVFKQLLEKTQKFSIDFHDRSSGKTTTGQVRLLLKTPAEAEQVKEELKAFRETLSIEKMAFEFKESEDDFLPIVKKEQPPHTGSVVQRLLFVGNLPSDVTDATLSDLFPDALRVILPHKEMEENAETDLEQQTPPRHAYIEYASEEEAAGALDTHREKQLKDEKLFVTRAIAVRKDRFGLLSDSLRQIFLEKVRKLQRIQRNPYNKSQHDLNEIEKTIIQTKEKLASDTAHRKGWGMLLGRLDESVIDREEEPKQIASINQGGRGGNQRVRGNNRGNNFRGGQSRGRGGQMGGMMGNQRGGFGGYNAGGGMGYGRGGGWNAGYMGGAGQYQSYYGGGGAAYPTQSYGGGYNQFSGNKRRASYDNYTGDWKRGRGSYQQY